MDEDSNQERQENELEALKAIYGEQLHEAKRAGEGDMWRPLDFVLSLGPQEGSNLQEAHTFVDLHIAFSENYPDEVPKMDITKSKGLTNNQVEMLLRNLNVQAENLKGEVMVFELASFVQSFLHQNNRPGFESLYDEMWKRQIKKQQKEEEQKKVLENKTRQEVLLEIQNKKEALRQEQRRRRTSEIVPEEDENYLPRFEEIAATAVKKPLLMSDILDNTDKNENAQTDNSLDDFSPWMVSPKGVSRLENEFEVLQFLGKGAFGDVLKVRNKLDRCFYAIKRIELNPMNKLLYKKITREVKLLSRLNHENVVRYFNSWIETITETDSSSCASELPSDKVEKLGCKVAEMLPINEVSVEWQLSKRNNSESSEDSSDNCWITFLPGSNESTSNGETNHVSEEQKTDCPSLSSTNENNSTSTQQFMYIQMEFCEKSTLRTAIDNGLYLDEKRVWRLLREIAEGLAHIHQQGIIHRDLKPVNVFIDSEDHVKIGDFGLATTNILHKTGVMIDQAEVLSTDLRQSGIGDTSHTGQVGTALYVAPELNTPSPKANYNQKVDIYSLGVMFFEMCYRPLQTNMERSKVLTDLRHEDCILPEDFTDNLNLTKTQLLRWMLSHDPLQRPSSAELLQSELLPPPQFEEFELQELLRRTINNPQSKLYKFLIASCFNQKMTTAQDVTYDMSVNKGRWFASLLEHVVERTRKVLQKHGAVNLSAPLLMPYGRSPLPPLPTTVSVMMRWGGVTMLPHDLRLSFARYLAHNPSVTHLKRYTIDRVYRERRVLGHHPRELYECDFDIVTPSVGNMLAEAELLAFVGQVLNEFPSLLHINCVVRLSHTALLRAILLHCGIEASKHNRVCHLLSQSKDDSHTKGQIGDLLASLDLPDHTVHMLFNLLDQEHSFSRASTILPPMFRRSSATSSLCKQAFLHLEKCISHATELGVKCSILVCPGLVDNLSHYSGLIYQVVWEQKNKHGKNQRTIIAGGGRYDSLIASLRQMHEGGHQQSDGVQCAAGVSVSMDKIVSCLQAQLTSQPQCCDVVVCSVNTRLCSVTRDQLSLTRDLWAADVRAYLSSTVQSLEEVQSFCLEANVPHIVMFKDTDPGYVRIRTNNKDRWCEKKVLLSECVDHMVRLCQPSETNGSLRIETAKSALTTAPSDTPVMSVTFLTGEKMSSAMKRRCETQVLNSMVSTIQRLSAKVRVEVLAVNMETEVIKMLASYIDLDSDEQDTSATIKRFPKHKKMIFRVSEQLQELKNNNSPATVVLYSILDNTFKVLL